MRTKGFSKLLKFLICLFGLFIVLDLTSSAIAQQFPIGTYWVRDPNAQERHDMYNQVNQCGINIVVGGTNYYSDPLNAILDAADANDIQLIVNNAAQYSYIYTYSNSYRMQYESTGYHSDQDYPRLVSIEGPILYDFNHEVGEFYPDNDTYDNEAWRAVVPGTAGYLLHNYSGSDWQDAAYYYASFRLKIEGDVSQHTPVARLLIVRNGSENRLDEQIYADDFIASGQYQEFEYYFRSTTTAIGSSSSGEESYENMLPEGSSSLPTYEDLDYRVFWHGQVTLYVDYLAIENTTGDQLFDGNRDNNIRNEAINAHSQDPDHDTILGFYNDEPKIYEMEPIGYANNIIGPETPPGLSDRIVVCATINTNVLYHQYLNSGSIDNQDSRLLIDRYPIYGSDPLPGDPGYNNQIQYRWENNLIPYLSDAAYVCSINNRRFWYAAQAHSWLQSGVTQHRDPDPVEIRAMVNLGLCYGAKGIFYFLYTSIPAIPSNGLVDVSFNRNAKWYEVQQINEDLQNSAPDLLALDWLSSFTSGDAVPDGSVVQSISEGDYIEIGNFEHETTGYPYIMLVNRRCESTDTQIIDVTTNKSGNTYQLWDKLNNERYVSYDGVFRNISLEPGSGRLFEIRPIFENDETWSGIVNIDQNITVPTGIMLTIEDSATIKFAPNTSLDIYGNLNAQGTPTQKILFTSAATTPQSGDWNKIYFYNSGIDTLKHCDIEYGQGIHCGSGSNVRLNNVSVTNCPPFGLYMNNAFAIVDSCNFSNNGTSGIYLYSSGPHISHTTCTNNNYGLFCYNDYSDPNIGYSTFSNNNGDGIFSMYHAIPVLFYFEGVFPYGNNFMENNNNRGYAAVYYSWPFLGLVDYAPGNNVFQGNGNYALQNLNPYGTINAICNYWGTTDTTEIENMIYTSGYSITNFIPFLTAPPSPPSNMNLLAGATGLNNSLLSKTVLSSDPDEYNQLALTFLIRGNYEKASDLFQYVIENYPDSEAAKYALVHITTCYDKLDKLSSVLPYLEGVAELNVKLDLSTFALALSVSTLEKAGEYEQAEERCLQLIATSKDDAMNKNLVFVLANIYLNGLNEQEKAKQYFEEYINKYPKDELAQIAQDMLEMMDFRFIPKGDEPEKMQENNMPAAFALSQNYPNPFNPETKIVYQIPEECNVKFSIYNLQGQVIRELVNESKQPGAYSIQWDGRNNSGLKVVSGVYLYVFKTGKFTETKKMILLR